MKTEENPGIFAEETKQLPRVALLIDAENVNPCYADRIV